MNRVYLSVLAGLLALSGLLGYLVYSGGQEIAELKQTQDSLKEANNRLTEAAERAQARLKYDRQVLVARQAKIAAQARILDATKTELQNALRANKSWSDTDVPPDVQNALRGPSDGSGGVRNAD